MFDKCWIPSTYNFPTPKKPTKKPAKAKKVVTKAAPKKAPRKPRVSLPKELYAVQVEVIKGALQPSLQVFFTKAEAEAQYAELVEERGDKSSSKVQTMVSLILFEPGQDIVSDGQVLESTV